VQQHVSELVRDREPVHEHGLGSAAPVGDI
jgi:hypothetical protein